MKKVLKFWGTRGSCSVSGPEYLHYGGNTSCLEVRYQDTLLILDAGTGIRPLGATVLKEKKISLFLTHTHWDHLIGFPYFDPIFCEDIELTIWAPQGPFRSCKELFQEIFAPEFFPVDLGKLRARIAFKTLHPEKTIEIGSLKLQCCQTEHPGVTFSFKISTPHETIGYTSDNEVQLEKQQGFIAFHKGCDLFIHEAQYTKNEYLQKSGWGHSSIANAVSLVQEIRPKKWFVTHHDPKHTDDDLRSLEKLAATSSLPCPAIWVPDMYECKLK